MSKSGTNCMKELQKTVAKLSELRNHYVANINNVNDLRVHPNDIQFFNSFLTQLISQVFPYSPHIANSLNDIQANLFVRGAIVTFNPFRFGSLGTVLAYLKSNDFICNTSMYLNTSWNDINEAVKKLLEDSSLANVRLDYNQIGVAAREIYIMLAQKVYNPELHKNDDGKKIGKADAKGMLTAYLKYELQEQKLIDYATEAVKLAETVTHMKTEDIKRVQSLVIAVTSLVGIVNSVYRSK